MRLPVGVPRRGRPPAGEEVVERQHAGPPRVGVEGDDVAQRGQALADGEDLLELGRGRNQHRGRAGIAEDVLGLAGGKGRIDRHVGAARREAGVVGDRPLRAVFRQDRDPVAVADAQLAQAEAGRLHPFGQVAIAQLEPLPVAPDARGHRAGGEPLDRPEIELGERGRRGAPYGVKRTMKRWPEPGTVAPRVRSARTVTTMLSGGATPGSFTRVAIADPSEPVKIVSDTTCPPSRTVGVVTAGSGEVMAVDHTAARQRAGGIEAADQGREVGQDGGIVGRRGEDRVTRDREGVRWGDHREQDRIRAQRSHGGLHSGRSRGDPGEPAAGGVDDRGGIGRDPGHGRRGAVTILVQRPGRELEGLSHLDGVRSRHADFDPYDAALALGEPAAAERRGRGEHQAEPSVHVVSGAGLPAISRRADSACRIHRSASGPLGGRARKARR